MPIIVAAAFSSLMPSFFAIADARCLLADARHADAGALISPADFLFRHFFRRLPLIFFMMLSCFV